MLTSTALVLLMVPGLAMFYGGLVRTKNVLGTMLHSFAAMAVVGVIWVVIGYALAFGPNALGGWIGWDPGLVFLRSIDGTVGSNGIPDLVFAMFQGKFAIITPALIAGAFAERVRFRGYVVFIALWSVLVYSPLAHWVWAPDGFLFELGAIDFAGGTVVHISAGISGLIAALYLGARRGYPRTAMHPNNLVMVMVGVGLLWVGWFGFNAGSSLSSGAKTAQALTVTQAAAAAAALAWVCIEAVHHRKATGLGVASGILAGLVAITPAAGVVTPAGAVALGFIAAGLCYGADPPQEPHRVRRHARRLRGPRHRWDGRGDPADLLHQGRRHARGQGHPLAARRPALQRERDDRVLRHRDHRARGVRGEGLPPAPRVHRRDGGHGPRAAWRARLRPAEPELAKRRRGEG